MCKKTIVFRADGNSTIGMGHVIRTLALAEMLNEEFQCIFATRNPTIYQTNEIEKVCHELIVLPDEESHFEQFIHKLTGNEIVVLDNYYFDTDYQQQIKELGCKLVCIDDTYDKHYVADAIINHAGGLNEDMFSRELYSKLYLGYDYALLRKPFFTIETFETEKKYACFIMIGGTDPYNITEKILLYLHENTFHLPIALVIGSANDKCKQFDKVRNICLFKDIDAVTVKHLMLESEFGIIPSSTSAIEACASRLPFITGFFVDNQKNLYANLKKDGLAICIGNLLEINQISLINAIEEINNKSTLKRIKENQMKLFDNKSKERVIKIFKEL